MNKKEIKSKVMEISEKIATNLGYEIVDVEYKQGEKSDLLSIFIFHEKGIDIDDCSKISGEIELELDKLDLIKNHYYLEVSSPGIDRPIKTESDFRRNLGKEVEVKLYAPINKVKEFEGILKDYSKDFVTIETENENIEVPLKSISIMRQTIKF